MTRPAPPSPEALAACAGGVVVNAHPKLVAERKRAAAVIRRHESGEPERLAGAVESGKTSAWGAMVEIAILPAMATIDALCRLRVVEAWAEGRMEATEQEDAPDGEALADCPDCGGVMPIGDDAVCPMAKCVAFSAWAAEQPQEDARDVGEP